MAAPPIGGWQQQILQRIGAPATQQNLVFLNDWAKAEGGSAANNPFNTTQSAPGASSYNSVGVRNYGSPAQGVAATVQTLENGRYGNILGALKQGGSAKAAASALAASPWGTGSLVLKMLGGGSGGSSSAAPLRQPMSVGAQAPSAGAPTGNPLLGSLLSQTNESVGLGSSPLLGSLLAGGSVKTAQPSAGPAQPAAGKGGIAELLREGTGGPTHSTGPHIHAAFTNPQLELEAIREAQGLGLHVGENPYVGDRVDPVHAPNSYHYRDFAGTYNGRKLGQAIDVSGGNTAPFYQWLQQRQAK